MDLDILGDIELLLRVDIQHLRALEGCLASMQGRGRDVKQVESCWMRKSILKVFGGPIVRLGIVN